MVVQIYLLVLLRISYGVSFLFLINYFNGLKLFHLITHIAPTAAVEGRSLCNHRRAYKFFIDSVAPRCLFPAFPCDSYDDFLKGQCFPSDEFCIENTDSAARCGNMGYYADRSTGRGQLYLLTREEEPFCAHQFNLEVYSSENDLPLRTLGRLDVVLEGEGTLNETFSVTEKDDTELFAGDIISRILVPHPALGFPHSITVTYKSYSGWLSKGLPQWTINKLVLTDSFGRKMSICKRNLSLISDIPIYFKLESGICVLDDENNTISSLPDLHTIATDESTIKTNNDLSLEYTYSTISSNNDEADRLREKKEIINLGSNFKIAPNTTFSYLKITDQLPWHPVIENLLENNIAADNKKQSVSKLESKVNSTDKIIETDCTISEDVLSTQQALETRSKKLNKKLKPALDTKPQEEIKVYNESKDLFNNNRSSTEFVRGRHNSYFTIQLLPFRLGELIERAERYARETILPLISEQAPRLFGFGGFNNISDKKNNDRATKYIPLFSELAVTDISSDAKYNRQERSRQNSLPPKLGKHLLIEPSDFEDEGKTKHDDDLLNKASNEKTIINITNDEYLIPATVVEDGLRYNKNILSLLRGHSEDIHSSHATSETNRRNYYTKATDVTLQQKHHVDQLDDTEELRVIHIELPTYKPVPKRMQN